MSNFVLTSTFTFGSRNLQTVKNFLCAVSAREKQFDTLDKALPDDAILFASEEQAEAFQTKHNLSRYTIEPLN